MREIKFRGKRLDNGEWLYGSLVILNGRYFIFDDANRHEVDPTTVGEFTGLKDKNGKEMYEGDILTDEFESIGVVEWRDGAFVVNFADIDFFQIADCFDDFYQMWSIGNIHDNPELLKTE